MKRALFAVAAAALTLSACETATPYQPIAVQASTARGGYSEQQLEDNRWKVEFSGNSLTSRQTVERYLLFRAAQLTLAQGDDWFQTVDRNTHRQTDYYSDGFGYDGFGGFGGYGFGGGPYWGLYRRGFGWGYGYFGDPGFGGYDLQEVSRYTATVEILLGHGAKPANPRAYDAHSVVEHLQASIRYPKTT